MAVLETIQFTIDTPAVADEGSVTWSGAGQDEDQITIDDGTNGAVVFEAGVDYVTGEDETATAANFAAAVNLANLQVSAEAALGVVTLTAKVAGAFGATVSETVDGATEISVSDFAGGTAAVMTVEISNTAATPDFVLSKHGDGSVEFEDTLGNSTRVHGSPEMTKLYAALRAAAQA